MEKKDTTTSSGRRVSKRRTTETVLSSLPSTSFAYPSSSSSSTCIHRDFCTPHYWHAFFELLRSCRTTIETLRLYQKHRCVCRDNSTYGLTSDIRARVTRLVIKNEECARSLQTILGELENIRNEEQPMLEAAEESVSTSLVTPTHVYVIFRFHDLTTIGDHFTCSKRRTLNVTTYNDIDTNTVLFQLSLSGGEHETDDASTTNEASNLMCGHNRSLPHYLLNGWYIARRLKTGFAQFLREKRKFWRSLTYLGHYEHPDHDVSYASIVCTHLAEMYTNVCFNVHGNVIYASTSSVDVARRQSPPLDFLPDQTILRVCEHVLANVRRLNNLSPPKVDENETTSTESK